MSKDVHNQSNVAKSSGSIDASGRIYTKTKTENGELDITGMKHRKDSFQEEGQKVKGPGKNAMIGHGAYFDADGDGIFSP